MAKIIDLAVVCSIKEIIDSIKSVLNEKTYGLGTCDVLDINKKIDEIIKLCEKNNLLKNKIKIIKRARLKGIAPVGGVDLQNALNKITNEIEEMIGKAKKSENAEAA